jgi:hypothetical protein
VAYHVLKCDTAANAKGEAVDPACTNKKLAKLTAAFAQADALGPCPGSVATLQNDIMVFAGNLNGAVGNTTSPRTASNCDAKKVKAMSRMARGFLASMARAASTARSPFRGIIIANSRALKEIGVSNAVGPGCTNGSNRNTIQDDAVDPFVTAVSDHLTAP